MTSWPIFCFTLCGFLISQVENVLFKKIITYDIKAHIQFHSLQLLNFLG